METTVLRFSGDEWLYSSSHPSHVKNSIPFSQFLRPYRLCSDDSDFFLQIRVNVPLFRKTWLPFFCRSSGWPPRATYWSTVITTNVTKKEHSDRIPFTLRFHPHNHSVKSIKLLQNNPETGTIFSQPPLISFKRDIGNFLIRSSFQTNDQPGTFKCARTRSKTCPFIHNAKKVSIKISDHFTCTSANVIYCITCTYCKKIYVCETGRRLRDRFREHDVGLRITTSSCGKCLFPKNKMLPCVPPWHDGQ